MSEQASSTRQCPYCREEVDGQAVRCRHCQASIPPQPEPTHEGVCPFCRESIHPEAIRCKHCKADLAPGAPRTVGPGGERTAALGPPAPFQRRAPGGRRLLVQRSGRPCGEGDGVERDRGVDPSGCLEVVHAGGAMYCLEYVYWEIDTDVTTCSYTECVLT